MMAVAVSLHTLSLAIVMVPSLLGSVDLLSEVTSGGIMSSKRESVIVTTLHDGKEVQRKKSKIKIIRCDECKAIITDEVKCQACGKRHLRGSPGKDTKTLGRSRFSILSL
jgi:hypothetical protein